MVKKPDKAMVVIVVTTFRFHDSYETRVKIRISVYPSYFPRYQISALDSEWIIRKLPVCRKYWRK